jgi:6-phosphogluconolactonase
MVGVGMMSGIIHFHKFKTIIDLVEELSKEISKNLQEAIDKNGKATLIVSGGSTPKPLFEKLKKVKIEWEKVTIGLCDERWVSDNCEDSNEKFVKKYLLQDEASKAKFVGLFVDGKSAEEAENECSDLVEKNLKPFDVLILGMGKDAHTASLFPNNLKLDISFNTQKSCIAIEPKTAPHLRMSLTLSSILSAKYLYLHFEGTSKLAVFEKAVAGNDMHAMPIRSILNQDKKDVEVYYS